MLEKSKKILLFTTAYRPFIGGSEIAIENIHRRLPELFFDIITPRYRRDLKSETFDNVRVHRLGLGTGLDKYLFPFTGFFYGLWILFRNRYALIHAYQASYGAGAAWFLSFFVSQPFILTLQEGKNLDAQSVFIRFFRSVLLRKADHITVISTHLKTYVEKLIERNHVEIIPNGVDVTNFSRDISLADKARLQSELSIPENAPVVITVSRLVWKNGIDILLRAFYLLTHRDAVLVIIGDGELSDKLHKLSQVWGIASRIRWVPIVEHTRLPSYFALAHVFIRPSRSEGLGNVFLEAMAAGVPVIAPLVGGIPDFLKDGVTGYAISLEPENIAAVTDRVLDNSNRVVVDTARQFVKEYYSWDSIADRMRNVYART